MKKTLFLLVFLLSFSLAWAIVLETDKTDYMKGQLVQIDIKDCSSISVLQITSPVPNLLTVEQGSSNWHTFYNTASEVSKGKYRLLASCEDRTTTIKFFCVDAPGCTTTITPAAAVCGDGSCNGEETCSSCPSDCGGCPSPGGHSRGGSSCWANWSCSNWELCGRNLTQKRICYDGAECLPAKTESRACTPCDESWICTIWSGCQYGQQVRKCYDERFCETDTKRPTEQKACKVADTGFAPNKIIQTPPKQFIPPKKAIPLPTFLDTYGKWLIGILGALIVLGLVVFFYFHFHKKGGKVTDIAELESWMEKGLDAGKEEKKLKEAAKQSGGWSEQEVDEAFAAIKKK